MTQTAPQTGLRQRLDALRQKHFPQGSLRGSLAGSAFWSLLGGVFSRGMNLASSIIVARLLKAQLGDEPAKAGFALWGIAVGTIVSLFAGVAGLGIATAAARYTAHLRTTDPAKAGRTLSLALLAALIGAVTMAIMLVAAAWPVANYIFEKPQLTHLLILAAPLLLFTVLNGILQGALSGFEAFDRIARNNIAQGFVMFGLTAVLTWRWQLEGAVIAAGATWLITSALAWRQLRAACRQHGIKLSVHGAWQERALLHVCSLPSVLQSLLVGTATMLSEGVVSRLPGGLTGLGGYKAAQQWRMIVMFVPDTISRIALPMLSRLEAAGDRRRYRLALMANVAINGGVALMVALPVAAVSKWILSFYGPAFVQDWDLLALLALTAVFQAIEAVVSQVAASKEKFWWNFMVHIVWATLLLAGSYLLVPRYGVRGYVWTLCAAYLVHCIINFVTAMVLAGRNAPDAKTA